MNQDIRRPLGWTFLITGLLLVFYGSLTRGQPMYAKCGGWNLNLIWGSVMSTFAIVLLVLTAKMARRKPAHTYVQSHPC